VHALLAGFVQDSLIENQNHRHKTEKIVPQTFLARTKIRPAKTLAQKDLAEQTRTIIWKRLTLTKKRQSQRSRDNFTKPRLTEMRAKNLEADFCDSTKPTENFADERKLVEQENKNLKTCLLQTRLELDLKTRRR